MKKKRNYFARYLVLVLPLLFINLNAQEEVDALEAARLAKSAAEKAQAEADAATEAAIQSAATKAAAQAREDAVQAKKDAEAKKLADEEAAEAKRLADEKAAEEAELDALAKAAGDEARRKIAQELGLDDGSSEEEATTEEAESTEATATEEVAVADEVEELAVKEELGFSIGLAPSIGFVSGASFTSVPTGATVVITTPYGFKLGPLDFTISAAFGGYSGKYESEKDDTYSGGEIWVDEFNPTIMGVGGNLTLATFVFAEGHAGIVGKGTGIRGFTGVSLEYLMKKGLNLPVNILVGGEGFISTDISGIGTTSGWGGLGVRLDYDF
jgi:hypothetical protein